MIWNLWWALRPNGDGFRWVRMWPLPPVSPEHPMSFWLAVMVHSGLVLAGLDMMLSGLIGIRPFSLGN
jgi:hypothetical protein